MIIISTVLNDDQGGHMGNQLTDSLWQLEPAGVFRARLTPSAHLAGARHINAFCRKTIKSSLSYRVDFRGIRISSTYPVRWQAGQWSPFYISNFQTVQFGNL